MATVQELRALGARLRARREEAGLTLEELAGRSGLKADLVKAHERGEKLLVASQLARLAEVLDVPLAGLISVRAPETTAPKDIVTLLRTVRVGDLSAEDAQAIVPLARQARAFAAVCTLLKGERLLLPLRPHPAPRRKAYLDGYSAARTVRATLDLHGPLRELRDLIEDRFNVLVAERSFRSRHVLGASCRSAEGQLIVVDKKLRNEDRLRFVLAHELAHLLLDFDADGARVDNREDDTSFFMENPPEEQRANAFSVMFLAPEDAVFKELGQPKGEGYGLVDARKLVNELRRAFGLSFSAAAWHLHNLGYFRAEETVRSLLLETTHDRVEGFERSHSGSALERYIGRALEHEVLSRGRAQELLGRSRFELATP